MRTASLAVALAVAGCAVGPDFKRPSPPTVTGYASGAAPKRTVSAPGDFGAAQRYVEGMGISAQWWTLFRSQPLNVLIEQSIKANPGLTAAQAALRQARENALAQKGAYYRYYGANAPINEINGLIASGKPEM
jgi:outer membrane protein TolC